MATHKVDLGKLDHIIKKAVEAITNSKGEIYGIAENARKECKKLDEELQQLKQQVKELIETIENMENELKDSKKKLLYVNKNFDKFSEDQLKEAYEKADSLRIGLAVKREQEQFLIKRRNDLEVRIKDSVKTVQRAENLISQVGAALGYLTGDLQELSMQLEDMQQKQNLGLRIIKAQEEERQRVARDIHDGPAQSMSNVVLKAEICERLIDVDLEKSRHELKQLKRIVRESLQDVRRIIYDLRPMSLDDLGLVPTLQRHVTIFQEESGIATTFRTRGNYENIKPVIALTVFRIVQEAINNVRKHANAKNITIALELFNGELKLLVRDDGKGFNVEELRKKSEDMNSGFGLVSMKERIELLDGSFDIKSQPGKGTWLNISIPLITEEVGQDG